MPFCRHRCGYCNFTLVTGRNDLVGEYMRAIEIELAASRPESARKRVVDTLYFGGGTPTYLAPLQLRQLIELVLACHPLVRLGELTVEANPADIKPCMIHMLSSVGVTRLSLGAQSFRTKKLRLLERDHQSSDVGEATAIIKQNKMNVAIDLIFATPGESLEQWADDLERVIELEPDHISTYGLTFERGTAFYSRRLRGELLECDEGLQRDMYALAIDRLTCAGYEHYEVSNFARPGCRSRHNQVYWSGQGYFAYGPGAARYINGVRETNHRSTSTYLKRVLSGESPVVEREELVPEARARELLVFGLRRMEGVSRADFQQRTGLEVDELIASPLRKLVDCGLLSDDGERIQLTREGLFVSDAIWPEML